MRHLFILISCIILFSKGYAQEDLSLISPVDSTAIQISQSINSLVNLQIRQIQSNRYKIYPTENIYNLIKLDTQTGKLDLVQWSLKSKDEFSITLNRDDLSYYDDLNSFELYPTKNIYQFILLDKATGRTWHVQWGTKSSERWIKRIQ